jgi:SAM-dependent methyltransferase
MESRYGQPELNKKLDDTAMSESGNTAQKMETCLNLGCGDTAPANWHNYDSSFHAQLIKWPAVYRLAKRFGLVSGAVWPTNVRFLSLSKRLPWPNGSVDCVYASHVFEHLDIKTRDKFLREALRVLRPGGVLRLVVPDLLYHARKYANTASDTSSRAEEFLYVMNLSLPEREGLVKRIYNLMMGYPSVHKHMYDAATLSRMVAQYGFIDGQFFDYGVSPIIGSIKSVEGRGEGYEGSIYLEALKPCE